jgi:hypothetical protein
MFPETSIGNCGFFRFRNKLFKRRKRLEISQMNWKTLLFCFFTWFVLSELPPDHQTLDTSTLQGETFQFETQASVSHFYDKGQSLNEINHQFSIQVQRRLLARVDQ